MCCVIKVNQLVIFFIVSFFFLMILLPPRSTLFSLHDALPICAHKPVFLQLVHGGGEHRKRAGHRRRDRKSTRLNSSHANISYAVFCLKKKKRQLIVPTPDQYPCNHYGGSAPVRDSSRDICVLR